MHSITPRPARRGPIVLFVIAVAVGLGLTSCAALANAAHLVPPHGSATTSAEGDASDPTPDAAGGAAPDSAKTAANGYFVNPISPFDEDSPAIANLNPELRSAVQAAATDADADGVDLVINSGWRSASYQRALLNDAVAKYGSMAEARKWVNTPKRSPHVSGNAVDVGYTDADSWLSQHGANYGLCQIYANEMWHFELAVEPGGTCPEQLTDATAG